MLNRQRTSIGKGPENLLQLVGLRVDRDYWIPDSTPEQVQMPAAFLKSAALQVSPESQHGEVVALC